MWRIDKEMPGSSPAKLQVLDADGNVIANITSLNGFMRFKRAWAAIHKIKTKNVALAVACEGGLYHLLDSKPAFREFAAGFVEGGFRLRAICDLLRELLEVRPASAEPTRR